MTDPKVIQPGYHADQEHREKPDQAAPGIEYRITVDSDEPRQALEKLLALAMAISNDFVHFEQTTRRDT